MKLLAIQQTDYDDVLALNAESVPHVNLIGRDQLLWFDDHASFVQVVKIDDSLAGFLLAYAPA